MELSDAQNLDGLYRAAAIVEAQQTLAALEKENPVLTIGKIKLQFSQVFKACESPQWLHDLALRAGFKTDFEALFRAIAEAVAGLDIERAESVILRFAINIQSNKVRRVTEMPDERDYFPHY